MLETFGVYVSNIPEPLSEVLLAGIREQIDLRGIKCRLTIGRNKTECKYKSLCQKPFVFVFILSGCGLPAQAGNALGSNGKAESLGFL